MENQTSEKKKLKNEQKSFEELVFECSSVEELSDLLIKINNEQLQKRNQLLNQLLKKETLVISNNLNDPVEVERQFSLERQRYIREDEQLKKDFTQKEQLITKKKKLFEERSLNEITTILATENELVRFEKEKFQQHLEVQQMENEFRLKRMQQDFEMEQIILKSQISSEQRKTNYADVSKEFIKSIALVSRFRLIVVVIITCTLYVLFRYSEQNLEFNPYFPIFLLFLVTFYALLERLQVFNARQIVKYIASLSDNE